MSEAIEFEYHDEKVKKLLGGIIKRMGNAKILMANIGEDVVESIQRNFEEGGRPTKWKKLKKVTTDQRKKSGKWPGKILFRSGVLMKGVVYKPFNNRVVVYAGSNMSKDYAAIHHFGGMAGRGRKVKIPARPYMMIQDEDLKEMKAELNKFIIMGKTS